MLAGRGFALLHLFVTVGKHLSKDEAHNYTEHVGRNADRIRGVIGWTPRFLPQVSVQA